MERPPSTCSERLWIPRTSEITKGHHVRVIPVKTMGFVFQTSENQHVCVDEVTGENSASSGTLDNQETQDVEDVYPPIGQCTTQSHPEHTLVKFAK